MLGSMQHEWINELFSLRCISVSAKNLCTLSPQVGVRSHQRLQWTVKWLVTFLG